MKFILFIMLVLLVAFAVWWITRHGKIELVAHAKLLFKTWSLWLASIGSFVGAWVQSFPDSAAYLGDNSEELSASSSTGHELPQR